MIFLYFILLFTLVPVLLFQVLIDLFGFIKGQFRL